MVTRPTCGGKFAKASKGGGPPQSIATARPSSAAMVTPPKTEATKRKKRRTTPKCTVTSETIPEVEKRTKVVPESPDSEAEGSFRDSDRTVSAPENSPNTSQ